ncbi:MAG TPA: SRPBCC domain-containing protein [Candidatus Hydrogenedentes bacterium]|nr:SRPBCC domain-containing protein [Candidatus Hydrogenedentota bacterium]HRK33879.1 SRPBCC domain-containing protein [Candidatus Hydrogenedentota bacterium]
MARYGSEYTETFTVDVPIDDAKAHFSNLDAIAKCYGDVKSAKKLAKPGTMKLTLKPKTEIGVTFNGEHTCTWSFKDAKTLVWESDGKGNIISKGSAKFTAVGKKKTKITYTEHMELDMEVAFLLKALIGPVVTKQIRDGVHDYLERMRDMLE